MSVPAYFTDPTAPPPVAPPQLGELVPLGHAVINVHVKAQATMPGTPSGYSADLEVMADQGDLDTSALDGAQGPPGPISFATRQIIDPTANDPTRLKPLTDTPHDIGRYYIIQEHDSQGLVTAQWAYIWYGASYRKLMMGSWGPPGPVPDITPDVELIDPSAQSYVETFGPRLDPFWLFHLAAPAGPSGPVSALGSFPDVMDTGAVSGDVFMFSGQYTGDGHSIWRPGGLGNYLPRTYSVPQSAFAGYAGVAQQVLVGYFAIPPQPFPWTPIVWGHLGEGGVTISKSPFRVGCQVLLGDPVIGTQIGRGMGTTIGEVNIFPHYSTSKDKAKSISPVNGYAIVPPNHVNAAQGSVYVNLWNDGKLGVYNFNPRNAQLYVTVMPMLQASYSSLGGGAGGTPGGGGPTTPPVEMVGHCNNLFPAFEKTIVAGDAVVVVMGGVVLSGSSVVVSAPHLNPLGPITPTGTFAIWNPGSTNCIQTPAGDDGVAYWISAWVMPDCPATNGVAINVTGSGVVHGFDAYEVMGLGSTPVINTQSHNSGQHDLAYDSGTIFPAAVNALIIAEAYSGGAFATIPGAPWVNNTEINRIAGYQLQNTPNQLYNWSGSLVLRGAWASAIAAISAE
jgi:hypothetical protein